MRRRAARRGAGPLVAVAALALLAGGCARSSDRTARGTTTSAPAPPPSSTTTSAAVRTKDEYLRAGDAICADFDRKQDALPELGPEPADEDVDRFNQQSEALLRELVQALKALEPPPADRAVVEQINAAADVVLVAEGRVTAAAAAGDDAALDQAEADADAAWDQFNLLARNYGFVACATELEAEAPSEGP